MARLTRSGEVSPQKERRFKTADNRWGKGKVHRYLYSPENRTWYVACRGVHRGDPYGRQTEDDTEVTCVRCNPQWTKTA